MKAINMLDRIRKGNRTELDITSVPNQHQQINDLTRAKSLQYLAELEALLL